MLTNTEDDVMIMLNIFPICIQEPIRIELSWFHKFSWVVHNVKEVWHDSCSPGDSDSSALKNKVFLSIMGQTQWSNARDSEDFLYDTFSVGQIGSEINQCREVYVEYSYQLKPDSTQTHSTHIIPRKIT